MSGFSLHGILWLPYKTKLKASEAQKFRASSLGFSGNLNRRAKSEFGAIRGTEPFVWFKLLQGPKRAAVGALVITI